MLKTYEATFKEDSDGVFSISLVNDPATQEVFIALSKQTEVKLAEVDKEQRILMGLVLQPDQLIYRKNEETGEEFNIVFREDTIKELSHNFFKSGFQLNSKLEHDEPIKGITVVESWLVENSAIDKSANFGMSYPKGSWMATMKVDSDDIWNNYVKTGKVQGFSVDAMVDLKEVNFKSNIKMAEDKNGYFRVGLNKNGKTKIRTIHQLVAIEFLNHIPNGHLIHVDHIDGNESNNNINNLQILTAREHVTKTFLGKKTSSKYTGVSLNKASNKFQARIVINGKAIHLGVFKNEHDAHLAYQNALKQL